MGAQQVVSIAEQQLGISGRPNKFTNWYGSIGGTTSYAWCVVFIGWCFSKAGLSIFPKTASVACVLDYAKSNGYFKAKSGYTPKAGDVMIQQSGGASHVGIVTGTGNNCFYTIEGNCSNAVKKVTRYYDGKLTGFFVPPYEEGSSASDYETDDTELPKDPVLYDSFGTGGNTVNESFSQSREETHAFYSGGNDITKYVGNLLWQNTIDELATTVSFEVAKSDTKYINLYTPKLGDIINLYTNVEILRGIIVSVDNGSEFVNKYTACDFGWYLNKSTETYQFNKMTAYKAIRKICEDSNIPIDNIPMLETEITKIYADKVLSDIIRDILSQCEGTYNFDITPAGLRIYTLGSLYAYPEFRITPNTRLIYSPTLRGNVSHTLSIEEMKNSVKVISEKDSAYTVQTVLKDENSIYKYGFLQEVIKIDPEKENAQSAAQTKLAQLLNPAETFSIEIIEALDSYTRAGMVLNIDDTDYLIESAQHSVKNGVHYVKMDLRRFG